MSWEAVQWANRQRLRLPQEQLVLLMLANSADPEGMAFTWWKRKEHWWTYLVDTTRLSRASIFRHLATLEKLELAQRQKLVLGDGTIRFLIELNFDKVVDIGSEEAADLQDIEGQSHGETGEIAETQSHGETDSVSLVRLHKSLPKESKEEEIPPTPQAPNEPLQSQPNETKNLNQAQQPNETKDEAQQGQPSEDEIEGLDTFREIYGIHCAKPALLAWEWAKLSAEQRSQATQGAQGVAAILRRNPKAKGILGPLAFVRSQPAWAEFARFAPQTVKTPPPRVQIEFDSPEWRARSVLYAIIGRDMPQPKADAATSVRCAEFLGTLPPAGLALARFVDVAGRIDRSTWVFLHAPDERLDTVPAVERDRGKLAAWRERIRECLGIEISLRNAKLPFPAQMRQPGTDAVIETKYGNGLWVPSEWPPPKGPARPMLTGQDRDFMAQAGGLG